MLSTCDMLGFDFLHLANKGKMIIIVAPEKADEAIKTIKKAHMEKKRKSSGKLYIFL